MSGSTGRKWLIGCGAGCLVALLAFVLVIVAGAMWVKRTGDRFEEAIAAREKLEQRIGDVPPYTPRADGAIPAERLESFLAIRESQAEAREAIEQFFGSVLLDRDEVRELEEASSGERARTIWSMVRGGFGVAGDLGEFYELRNRGLLEHEMSLGEYTYIYTLTYHVWLAHPPDEGPGTGERHQVDMGGSSSRRVHEVLLDALRNQLASLGTDADGDWRARLEQEIAAMEQDIDYLPWRDGLPAAIEESLQPYRERLEANYSAATNGLELGRTSKKGWGSFTTD